MGCVSSNDVKEIDPPIEKTDAAQNHTIPEIQINGPSNSPSKENGLLASNHHPVSPTANGDATVLEASQDSSEKGEETPKEVTPPPPMFPHVSPFKPQFDFKRDVTLSPRASKYFETNGVAGDDSIIVTSPEKGAAGDEHGHPPGHDDMGMSVGEMDAKDVQLESPAHDDSTRSDMQPDMENSCAPKADEESDIPTTTTPRSTDAPAPTTTHTDTSQEGEQLTSEAPEAEAAASQSEEKPLLLDDVSVDVGAGAATATTTVTTDEEMAAASAADDEDKSTPPADSSEPTATPSKPQAEDRSAILASYLDHQAGPAVLGSDEEDSPFPSRPENDPEFLANQVDDDCMEQSKTKTPPLLSGTEGAAGDTKEGSQEMSVCQRHHAASGGNGDVDTAFSPEEKAKLNELLHEIEAIAEKNGYFDN